MRGSAGSHSGGGKFKKDMKMNKMAKFELYLVKNRWPNVELCVG